MPVENATLQTIDWIKQSGQWADCRLVTAANAALMLGLQPRRPEEDIERWLYMVRRCGAEYGGAISPYIADHEFGVAALRYKTPWRVSDLAPPTGLCIFDTKAGFHEVLVVENDPGAIGLVGVNWMPEVIQFTHREVEELLPSRYRQASLFIRAEYDGSCVVARCR